VTFLAAAFVPAAGGQHGDARSVQAEPAVVTLEEVAPSGVLADGAPTLKGTAEPGTVTVLISPGPSTSGEALRTLRTTAGDDGKFAVKVDPPLGEGVYTAQARQQDATGGEHASEPRTFEVDLTPPRIEISAPANDALLPTLQPTITGRAGTATRDGDTVAVTLSGPVTVTAVGSRGDDGAFQINLGPGLVDGQYTIIARQSDQAGNVGASTPITITLDATPPKTLVTSGATPRSAGPWAVRVEFGADEAATFACTLDGVRLPSPCTSPLLLSNLRAGRHTLRITARDLAGNADPTPAVLPFTIDVAAPNVSVAKKISVSRNGAISVAVKCPTAQALGPCAGNIQVRRGKRSLLKKALRFTLKPGASRRLQGRLKASVLRQLKRNGRLRVEVLITTRDARGNVGRKRFKRTLVFPK